MPAHADAIGYIRDLGHSEGLPWLEMICDLAAAGTTTLGPTDLEILFQLFTGRASYIRQPAPPTPPSAASVAGSPAGPIERLEAIGPFIGFKRLGDSLTATFPKRVSIIFGANGSGKSSLCEALQILASTDAPRRPLHNVRSTATLSPSFTYKFTSDVAPHTWTPTTAYGVRSSSLKYFDAMIAVHNVVSSVQPGRIIELSPFKLDVFETALRHCKELRDKLVEKQNENAAELMRLAERIRCTFKGFAGSVLAELTNPATVVIDEELKLGGAYLEKSGLDEKLKHKAELEKATSEEGLKLLKAEASALRALHGEIQPILEASEKLVEIDPVAQSRVLKLKENELELLAKALIPSGANLDKLMELVRPANAICNLNSPPTAECPLCKQTLGECELVLFKQYAGLLTGDLDTAITELRRLVNTANKHLKVIAESTPDDWARGSVLAVEAIEATRSAGREIQRRFRIGVEIDQQCKDAASAIRSIRDDLSHRFEEKDKLIEAAEKNREDLLEQLARVSAECRRLLYAKTVAENVDILKDARRATHDADFWATKLPDFTSVLRKVTSAAKRAHKELVVGDFKTRLNAEYLALAEKDMSAFGVELKDVGGDGAVSVEHHVAGQRIDSVLSEGEQRIHALALFFAELGTCEQRVIVFDDPISSFDYNYIENYCNRLRDLVLAHPIRQIIVFTHNWEFFVQAQRTLNTARLDQHMAVYVLESCVAIDQYSENIDDLKADIDAILGGAGEPSRSQKEIMAGKMRRLIESLVNTHVFNKQRHQYKQKSQQVSAFDDFTKVVPLLPTEAQTLRDLFAKLSITEHDDPRNAYVNTDKAMFQTRYGAIKAVETAIVGRK